MSDVWLYLVLLQQKLPLSKCTFTWIKYSFAWAAVLQYIQLHSLSLTVYPHWVDSSSILSILSCIPFPNFPAFSSCISLQALLNIPLFHMRLLSNLSSALWLQWKPHDLFMLMDFPCIQPGLSFPTVNSYWMWTSGPTAPSYMPESWYRQGFLSCSHDHRSY